MGRKATATESFPMSRASTMQYPSGYVQIRCFVRLCF